MDKRKLDISIISDAHLGTYECHAKELLNYLRSINPEVLVLNGDFIDINKARKGYFSKEHKNVIQEVLEMAYSGTKVYFIARNYESIIKKYSELSSSQIYFREKLELILNEKSYLIFHGSNIDSLSKEAWFSIKPGSKSYDVLLKAKRFLRKCESSIKGGSKYGLVKNQIKKSIQSISHFERSAIRIGQEKGYDYVVCGFIHEPSIKQIALENHSFVYMNSGDWVENLTALEYRFKKWKLYEYDESDYNFTNPKLRVKTKKTKITDSARYSA